jgi:squalene synthase HpnD
MNAPDLAAANAAVAKGSSFYLGMRVLPREQREAMYAVYAICRAVDDVADEGGPAPQRMAELQRWREDLEAFYAGGSPGRFAPVASAVKRYGLRAADFAALIDGMAMDAAADIRAPDLATLDLYCDRVASAVGRLSNRIFGIDDPDSETLAHHLGRALQLTNILRDLDEDAAIGRLYLPHEALAEAGIDSRAPAEVLAHRALGRACRPLVDQAHAHFAAAEPVIARQPRARTRAPRLMGAVYRLMLDRLVARGFAPPRERVRMSRPALIGILLKTVLL